MRIGVAVLTALIVLVVPHAALAATPTPTLSTEYGSATPRISGGTVTRRPGDPPMRVLVDWFQPDTSTLIAVPGGTVTITLDMAVDAVVARLDGHAGPLLSLVQTGERTYVATLPADTGLPRPFFLELAFALGEERHTSEWSEYLVGVPDPVPASSPEPVLAVPPATTGPARLTGRRLTVSVSCPAAAGSDCAGTLTLKTMALRVTRLAFTGIRPGSSVKLRATVRGAAVRHLTRHRVTRLRAVLTPTGGAPAVSSVRLKRA
jgi:hypothetical protein